MKRGVEDGEVDALRREGELVEGGLDGGEGVGVVGVAAQAIEIVECKVDGRESVLAGGEPIAEPAVACAEVENIELGGGCGGASASLREL